MGWNERKRDAAGGVSDKKEIKSWDAVKESERQL
jgi:hypothetical protein